MSKIVVVGDEDFTLGFELVGIEAFRFEEFEKLISKQSDTGIVVISQEDYDKLSARVKNDINKLLKPVVVILSKDDVKGGNLRDMVVRALGVDLFNK